MKLWSANGPVRSLVMGVAFRNFLIDREDCMYRLPNITFARMLDDPFSRGLPRFSGQRVRMADVAVEIINRQPIRVVRTSFSILTFDGQGFLDRTAFERHQYARAELALAPALGLPSRGKSLVEDRVKFIDHGGRWNPSNAIMRLIEKAALSRTPCPLL